MGVRLTIIDKPRSRGYRVHLGRSNHTLPLRTYCDMVGINYLSIRECILNWQEGYYQQEFNTMITRAIGRAQAKINKRYAPCGECRGFGWHRRTMADKRIDCVPCEGTGRLERWPDQPAVIDERMALAVQVQGIMLRVEDNPEGYTK